MIIVSVHIANVRIIAVSACKNSYHFGKKAGDVDAAPADIFDAVLFKRARANLDDPGTLRGFCGAFLRGPIRDAVAARISAP
jgi:hypothetical protein